MAFNGIAQYDHVVNAKTVAHDGTYLSDWQDCVTGFSFTVFLKQVSAAGTPAHTYTLHVSPYPYQYLRDLVTSGTDSTLYYVSQDIVAALTTESTLIRYAPNNFSTPCMSYRILVTGGGAAEDTVSDVFIVRFS